MKTFLILLTTLGFATSAMASQLTCDFCSHSESPAKCMSQSSSFEPQTLDPKFQSARVTIDVSAKGHDFKIEGSADNQFQVVGIEITDLVTKAKMRTMSGYNAIIGKLAHLSFNTAENHYFSVYCSVIEN